MIAALLSAAAALKARPRLWPYILGTAVSAAFSSTWFCHHLWIAPIPDSMNAESSAMGEMIVLFLMAVAVMGCTVFGALISWIVRSWSTEALGARQICGP